MEHSPINCLKDQIWRDTQRLIALQSDPTIQDYPGLNQEVRKLRSAIEIKTIIAEGLEESDATQEQI